MLTYILITGYNQSGKSTTAKNVKHLLENEGYKCCIKSFATPLKTLAAAYFDYNENTKLAQRNILDGFAYNLKEQFGLELFAYTMLENCNELDVDYVIIDDLRFVEEYKTISEFYPTCVIKTCDPEYIDELDRIRLEVLMRHFKMYDVPYFKMIDYTDRSLYNIVNTILESK